MAWVTKSSDEEYGPRPEPRTYTKQEKAANWWHYHWAALAAILAALGLAAWFVYDMVNQTDPDLRVGYVGQTTLLPETTEALQQALLPYVEDRNGDGQVVVQVSSYEVFFAPESSSDSALDDVLDDTQSTGETAPYDPYAQMAGTTQLSAEVGPSGETWLFLLEDPAGFQTQTQCLQYPDGTTPPDGEAGDWRQMVYLWSDCPVLTGLDLGDLAQPLPQPLYVGCRGSFTEEPVDGYAQSTALWHTLTEGAQPVGAAG